jgi:hypothetical protein
MSDGKPTSAEIAREVQTQSLDAIRARKEKFEDERAVAIVANLEAAKVRYAADRAAVAAAAAMVHTTPKKVY